MVGNATEETDKDSGVTEEGPCPRTSSLYACGNVEKAEDTAVEYFWG